MNTFKLTFSRDLALFMNYNICIIWWGVIASSCNKSLGVECLKLSCLRDLCVCVFMFVCVFME